MNTSYFTFLSVKPQICSLHSLTQFCSDTQYRICFRYHNTYLCRNEYNILSLFEIKFFFTAKVVIQTAVLPYKLLYSSYISWQVICQYLISYYRVHSFYFNYLYVISQNFGEFKLQNRIVDILCTYLEVSNI